MATIAKLAVDLVANSATFRRDLDKASRKSQSFFKKFQRGASRSAKSMALMGAKITAIATGPVLLGKSFIGAASDAEEMTSKFNVVFGKNAKEVAKWAENYGNKVGRATSELQQMASQVQDTFVPLGFARKEAAKMSTSLTQLAVDVASFNNTQDADTMRDFQSALVGNHETVRKYGIIVTEATLKQELVNLGMGRLTGAALEQAKVQARLNIIMRGTTDAHGDAIKTALSTANQEKALTAEYLEQSQAIGRLLLPSYNKLLTLGRKVISVFADLSDGAKKFIFISASVVAVTGVVMTLVGAFSLLALAALPALASIGAAVVSLTTAFIGLVISMAPIITTVVLVGGTLIAVAAIFWKFRKTIGNAFKGIGQFIFETLLLPIDNVLSAISSGFFNFFSGILEEAAQLANILGLDGMRDNLISASKAMEDFGKNSGHIVTDVVAPAVLAVGEGISNMTDLAGVGIQALWEDAKNSAIAAKQGFLDAVGLAEDPFAGLDEVVVGSQSAKDGLNGGDDGQREQKLNAFGQPIEDIQNEANTIKGIFADLNDFNTTQVENMTVNNVKSWGKLLKEAGKFSKAMAVIQRLSAIKSIIINTAQAISVAAKALPFPANIPGIAFAAGTGAVQLAAVRGQAHDGIDNVPNTGTYLLESGERVVDKRLNRDLSTYLAQAGNDNRTTNQSSNAEINFNVSGTDPEGLDNVLQNSRGQFEQMLRDVYAENALPDPLSA